VVTVVGLGPGAPEAVPVAAIDLLRRADAVLAPPLDDALVAALPVPVGLLPPLERLPDDAVIAAPDPEANALAATLPDAGTVPGREALRARAIGAQVARLVEVGRHLRRECPWDREQTAATIVPHTVEEAFEVAEAVAAGSSDRLADELGDLLFQSVFLAQLLEEAGDWDLGRIADGQADKLVSRHPHVYGDAVARDAGRVVDLWERRKREERAGQGIFHDLPAGLPGLAYAGKAQRRAAAVGFDFADERAALAKLAEEIGELDSAPGGDELGDVLFACVAAARRLGLDPELAVRASAERFRRRVERAAELATASGERFEALDPEAQLDWYRRAKTLG
jgi:XTP/dITP diphosphohydrolase/tetrapyrrole methylase family protein/MazG family protein/ATP diphosphatase